MFLFHTELRVVALLQVSLYKLLAFMQAQHITFYAAILCCTLALSLQICYYGVNLLN